MFYKFILGNVRFFCSPCFLCNEIKESDSIVKAYKIIGLQRGQVHPITHKSDGVCLPTRQVKGLSVTDFLKKVGHWVTDL